MRNTEDLMLMDATLRDGGLVNDFRFTDGFCKAVYKASVEAGIDYMEFGYRADKKQFDQAQYGKWKFSSDDDIRNIIGGEKAKLKVSVMLDVGRTDYKNDIRPKKESPVDVFRIATYLDTMPECIRMIEYISSLGYMTTCNIMAVSKETDKSLSDALDELAKSPVSAAYVVDSYGALYPKQIYDMVELFCEKMSGSGKFVGIHAHNNQQCGFANTLEAYNAGAKFLDGTVSGMGRGAGNCDTEALLGYFEGEKYHIEPMLDFIEKEMISLKESDVEWGYNTSYLLTGLTNQHPRSAITATKNKQTNYTEFYRMLLKQKRG